MLEFNLSYSFTNFNLWVAIYNLQKNILYVRDSQIVVEGKSR